MFIWINNNFCDLGSSTRTYVNPSLPEDNWGEIRVRILPRFFKQVVEFVFFGVHQFLVVEEEGVG